MSGHNKWSQIKHHKGAQDAKKSVAFSKILAAISIAAKGDPKPESNARLRALLEKAKETSVPKENIDRALKRASDSKDLKEFILEAYGPEGTAVLVEAITDNPNRLGQELRLIIHENNCKVADPGSVLWAFEQIADPQAHPGKSWRPKFPQAISAVALTTLKKLIDELEEREDIQKVITSAK